MPETLPIPYGYVVGRFLSVVGDSSGDADDLPDAIPLTGEVRFIPSAPIRLLTIGTPATAIQRSVRATLDANGYLMNADTARPGIWLVEGQYAVQFFFSDGTSYGPLTIQVTSAHTLASPLDLTVVAPAADPRPPVPGWQALTQAQYDALAAAGGLAGNTVYLITGA